MRRQIDLSSQNYRGELIIRFIVDLIMICRTRVRRRLSAVAAAIIAGIAIEAAPELSLAAEKPAGEKTPDLTPITIPVPSGTVRERRPTIEVRLAVPMEGVPEDLELTPDPKTLEVEVDGTNVTASVISLDRGRFAVRLPEGVILPLGPHRVDARAASRNGRAFVTTRTFYVLRPGIDALSPSDVLPGGRVEIEGAGFDTGKSPAVLFSGKIGEILEWEDRRIVALVPSGAVSGSVVVQTGDVETFPRPFRVVRASGFRDISGFGLLAGGTLSVLDAGAASDRNLFLVRPGAEGKPESIGGVAEARGPASGDGERVCLVRSGRARGDGELSCWKVDSGLLSAGRSGCLSCDPEDGVVPLAISTLKSAPNVSFVLDGSGGQVRRAGVEGATVLVTGLPKLLEWASERGLPRAALVLDDSAGGDAVADLYAGLGGRIFRARISPAGANPKTAAAELFAEGFSRIAGFALDDRNGLLVVDETSGEVSRIDRADPSRRSVLSIGHESPRGVAFRRVEGKPEVLVAEATRGIGLAGPSVSLGGADPSLPLELKGGIFAGGEGRVQGQKGAARGIELVLRISPAKFSPMRKNGKAVTSWSFRVVDVPSSAGEESSSFKDLPINSEDIWKEVAGYALSREGAGAVTEVAEGESRIRFEPPAQLPDGARVAISARIEGPPYDAIETETPPLPIRRPARTKEAQPTDRDFIPGRP